MKKRGQIFIFVVLAILVVLSIGIFFMLKINTSEKDKQKIAPEVAPIYSFVENCIKESGEDAVFYIGQTGGYFENPEESTSEYGTAYYFYNNQNLMPSKERIEKELGNYVSNMVSYCVNDFKDFPEFKVSSRKIETSPKINENKVVFNAVYPLTITKDGETFLLEEFKNIEIPARLDKIYEMAEKMIKEQLANKDKVCVSCITNLAYERDLYVQMTRYSDNETVIFTIIDKNSKIKENDYWFNFANKYQK